MHFGLRASARSLASLASPLGGEDEGEGGGFCAHREVGFQFNNSTHPPYPPGDAVSSKMVFIYDNSSEGFPSEVGDSGVGSSPLCRL